LQFVDERIATEFIVCQREFLPKARIILGFNRGYRETVDAVIAPLQVYFLVGMTG